MAAKHLRQAFWVSSMMCRYHWQLTFNEHPNHLCITPKASKPEHVQGVWGRVSEQGASEDGTKPIKPSPLLMQGEDLMWVYVGWHTWSMHLFYRCCCTASCGSTYMSAAHLEHTFILLLLAGSLIRPTYVGWHAWSVHILYPCWLDRS